MFKTLLIALASKPNVDLGRSVNTLKYAKLLGISDTCISLVL